MFSQRTHKATVWLALACYLTAATAAGMFHHHADLEGCRDHGCNHPAVAEQAPEEHAPAHAGPHHHSHRHPHHAHQHRTAEQPATNVVAKDCHEPCIACQFLSQISLRAPLAERELSGDRVATLVLPGFASPARLTTAEHPARGPPAIA